MKPITKGEGEEVFTLYFPFSILDGVTPFNLEEFILHLGRSLPKTVNVENVEGRGNYILKITGMPSFEEAINAFNRMKRAFLYLSIESDIAIYIFDSLSSIEKTCFHFPSSWPDGVNAGWKQDEELDVIKIDGIAHIVYPVIVPEHKRIVDSGILMGRLVKNIKAELFPIAINYSEVNQNNKNYSKGELAAKAYINAFSHANPSLRFLSLVTCLEILAEQKERSKAFKIVVQESVNAIKNIEIKGGQEEKDAIEKIASYVGKLQKQSIREALEDLINNSKEIIIKNLPEDHPHKNNPTAAVTDMYSLRSKIAHSGSLGKIINNKIHRSNQFAHCAAKTLLKNELNFY
jgi:hypothetical protein